MSMSKLSMRQNMKYIKNTLFLIKIQYIENSTEIKLGTELALFFLK